MSPKVATYRCAKCKKLKRRDDFSAHQRPRRTRRCIACTHNIAAVVFRCTKCKVVKPRGDFAIRQQRRHTRQCSQCTVHHRQRPEVSLALGSQINTCNHCGAPLFSSEPKGFCCNQGKYHVKFDQHFQIPSDYFQKLFKREVDKTHTMRLVLLRGPLWRIPSAVFPLCHGNTTCCFAWPNMRYKRQPWKRKFTSQALTVLRMFGFMEPCTARYILAKIGARCVTWWLTLAKEMQPRLPKTYTSRQ